MARPTLFAAWRPSGPGPHAALLVVLLALTAACGAAPSQRPPEAATERLRVGVSRNLINGPQDPWFTHNSLMVWEPLVGLDDDLQPVPALAQGWDVSPDGLVWTFRLRPNVVFSDGARWNAAAALANLDRLRRVSGHPSTFFNLDFARTYGPDTRIERVDDLTIRFVHQTPIPEFPGSIAHFFSAMFSPSHFDAMGDFTGLPVGTGPFLLESWERDRGFVLTRNPTYWGTAPKLASIVGRIYPDANVRLSALRAREVDALVELGPLLPAQGAQLRSSEEFVVAGMPSSCSVYLAYNGLKPPFDDVRLRRAVDYALPRQPLVDQLVFGFGSPGRGVLTSYAPRMRSAHPEAQVRYDPALAADLARQTLRARRAKVTLLFSVSTGSFARPFGQIAALLQSTLRPLGLDIELQQLENAAANEAMRAGAFHLTLSNGPGCAPFGDPDYPLRRLLSSTSTMNAAGEGNRGFANPEADRLLDEARRTLDPTARAALYDRLQQIAVSEVAISLLYSEEQVIAYHRSVKDLRQRVTYQPTLEKAYVSQ